MKLLFFAVLLAAFVATVLAVAPQKQVIVTYPKDTPDSVVDQAKNALRELGGFVTHEYKLIKGFAAKAPAKALETVSTLNAQWSPYIEEDSIVSVDGDLVENGHLD